MTRRSPFLIGLLLAATCSAQPRGVLSLGMANSGVAMNPELNPAMPSEPSLSFAVMQEYGIRELLNSRFTWSLTRVRLSSTTLRFDGYRESRAVMNVPLPGRTGLRLEHQFHRADGYRAVQRFLPVFGVQRPIGPRVTAATTIGRRSLAIGLALEFDQWTFVSDVVRIEESYSARVGWQAVLSPAFRLMGGLSANPPVLAMAALLNTGPIRSTLAFARHDALGWTTGLEARWLLSR